MRDVKQGSDAAWLAWLCVSRVSFALIFTAYAAAIPLLTREWGMSAGEAGFVQSAWHIGYLVSLFAVGFLADRYGAKRVFLLSGGAASVSALLFALFADGFVSATLLYGLTGLLSGGSYTPGLTLIAERFNAGRGRAMGFYLAAASLGYALALALSGALTPHIGWRGAFVVNALGPLAGMLCALYALRATPNIVHPAPDADTGSVGSIRMVLANRPAMLGIWAYTFHSWELLAMQAWLPAFLAASARLAGSDATLSASLGAALTAIAYLGSMVGSIAGGAISDRMGRTWTMLLMSCASLACSFAFGWLVSLPLWFLAAFAALYNFAAIGDSSVYSTAVTELVPPRYIGAAYSVRSVLGFGAGAIGPWVFGLVLDATRAAEASPTWMWGLAFCSVGLGGLLGPLTIWRLRQSPEAARMADGRR